MIRILNEIDIEPVLTCYRNLEASIEWQDYSYKGRQSGLQYRNNESQFLSAVGKKFEVESSFDNLNVLYKDTIFEKIINQYNLKRTRFIWLGANACYTFHKDTSPRIHVPIITNDQAFIIFKSGLIEHLSIGKVFWTDTRLEHTANNGGDQWRLHLVGSVPN